MQKKLYRSNENSWLGGVCGGLGEFFNIDPTLIRVVYVVLAIFSAGFPGLLIYIILCVVIPKAPEGYQPWQQEPPQDYQDMQ